MDAITAIFATYIFLIGLVIGSFLNVVIYRLPRGESLSKGRSHCPKCGHEIRWYDNIPLLSFLRLRAECRDCDASISPRYFLVELLTGLLFVAVFFKEAAGVSDILAWPSLIRLALYLYFTAVLVAVSFIDIDHHIIPNKIVYPAFVIGLVALVALERNLASFVNVLIGIIFGGGLLLLIYLVAPLVFKKQGMGFGDVKLGAVLGVYLGVPVILTLFLSSFIGTIYGAVMIASKRLKWQERFAFGPCLAAAALITYFFGTPIINWYLGLFLG